MVALRGSFACVGECGQFLCAHATPDKYRNDDERATRGIPALLAAVNPVNLPTIEVRDVNIFEILRSHTRAVSVEIPLPRQQAQRREYDDALESVDSFRADYGAAQGGYDREHSSKSVRKSDCDDDDRGMCGGAA